MFTGIITGVGRIAAVHDLGRSLDHGKRLEISTPAHYLDDVGLGDSIAQILGMHLPSPIEMVAVDDSFGESGTPEELLEKYGLNEQSIVAAAERAIARKK